jgi:hypothetical protein
MAVLWKGFVMAGLVAASHVFRAVAFQVVDARDKPGMAMMMVVRSR